MTERIVKKVVIKATKQKGEDLVIHAKKLRVCAYARVSTDMNDQTNSYNAQLEHYRRLITGHANWEFINLYGDEGASGTQSKNRPGFLKMMEDCRAGFIDLILVKQISRFGRNTMEGLSHIYELRSLGVEIYFETDNLYASDKKTDFLLQMLFAIAQEESRNISSRVTFGIREVMDQGDIKRLYTQSSGFTKSSTGNITVVPHEAYIYRSIANLRLGGISATSIHEIYSHFNNEPWYQKTYFTYNRIHDVCVNTKFAGDIVCQKSFVEDYLTHKSKKNNGERDMIIYKNALPEIIPRWFYEKCRIIRHNSKDKFGLFDPKDYDKNLFFCGKCGCYLTGTRTNQNSIFVNAPVGLKCDNALYINRPCDQHSISFTSTIAVAQRYLEMVHDFNIDDLIKNCLEAIEMLSEVKGKAKARFLGIYNEYKLNQEKLNLSLLASSLIENPSFKLNEEYIVKKKELEDSINTYSKENRRLKKALKDNATLNPIDSFSEIVKDKYRAMIILYVIRCLNVKIVEIDKSNILFIKLSDNVTDIEFQNKMQYYLSLERKKIETVPVIARAKNNTHEITYWKT